MTPGTLLVRFPAHSYDFSNHRYHPLGTRAGRRTPEYTVICIYCLLYCIYMLYADLTFVIILICDCKTGKGRPEPDVAVLGGLGYVVQT